METVVKLINELTGKSEQEVLSILSSTSLDPIDKNLVYLYLYPRPLMDKELPSRIIATRPNPDGSLTPSPIESVLILEASRTPQYGRFIKHLFHAYLDPGTIHPIEGSDIVHCCLCGKEFYELSLWKCYSKQYGEEEVRDKLFLAYGSTETNLPICIPCLLNLRRAIEIMEKIDPDYLKTVGIN